jgi:hypothetical protein
MSTQPDPFPPSPPPWRNVVVILRCPHCTLELVPCSGSCPILIDFPEEGCRGYAHKHNGQHACNPANPVYIAENPQKVAK